MRIGVITTSYPRWRHDPAGNFVAGHVAWLRHCGHQVEVICAGDSTPEHERWQPDVGLFPVPSPPGLFYAGGAPDALASRRRLFVRAARFTASLARAVARRAVTWDMVYAHWLVPCAVAAAMAPTSAPIVAIAHSGDVHLARRIGLVTPLAAAFAARRIRLVFVSDSLRQGFVEQVRPARLRHRIEGLSAVVPMGVDLDHFRSLGAKSDRLAGCPAVPLGGNSASHSLPEPQPAQLAGRPTAHPRPGPTAAGLTVLFLGRLVPIKGAHVLIAAATDLAALVGSPVRIVVAGDGPERARLECLAAELTDCAIEFAGEVGGDRRDRLLARADVLAIPSVPVAGERSEGSPVTALEAMAAGIPVVASRTGGLAELPANAVYLVPPGDSRQLAKAIANLWQDKASRRRQVESALSHVEKLDWSIVGPLLSWPTRRSNSVQ
ncbi:MAG: glycosyltransferase family 4 protein [Proteobacteria bacterium]|nr:glycosyltransferase family 4 protein [Pseudomonadota bacterium]